MATKVRLRDELKSDQKGLFGLFMALLLYID